MGVHYIWSSISRLFDHMQFFGVSKHLLKSRAKDTSVISSSKNPFDSFYRVLNKFPTRLQRREYPKVMRQARVLHSFHSHAGYI